MQLSSVRTRERIMRVLSLLLGLIASGFIPSAAAQGENVVIGVIGIYSGPFDLTESQQIKRAIDDRMSEVNRDGVLGKRLVVFFRDYQGDYSRAPQHARELVERDNAKFVLIHGGQASAVTASQALQEHRVPHAAVLIGSPGAADQAAALLEAWVERVKAAEKFDLSGR
jgi:ABC-type branched-subunit amino acid transport system substrate-binding protein